MDENKTKINMKIQLPAFSAEFETYVDEANVEKKMSTLLDTVEKAQKKIEKLFGSVAVKQDGTKVLEYKPQYPHENSSAPFINLSRKLGVDAQKLIGSNIFGFKDNKPQLFDTSKFKSSNTAVRALIYLFEVGLERKSITSEELKEAYDSSKIKGRNVSQILQDLIKTTQIDGSRYKGGKEVVLSAKGMTDAENEFKYLLGTGK